MNFVTIPKHLSHHSLVRTHFSSILYSICNKKQALQKKKEKEEKQKKPLREAPRSIPDSPCLWGHQAASPCRRPGRWDSGSRPLPLSRPRRGALLPPLDSAGPFSLLIAVSRRRAHYLMPAASWLRHAVRRFSFAHAVMPLCTYVSCQAFPRQESAPVRSGGRGIGSALPAEKAWLQALFPSPFTRPAVFRPGSVCACLLCRKE